MHICPSTLNSDLYPYRLTSFLSWGIRILFGAGQMMEPLMAKYRLKKSWHTIWTHSEQDIADSNSHSVSALSAMVSLGSLMSQYLFRVWNGEALPCCYGKRFWRGGKSEWSWSDITSLPAPVIGNAFLGSSLSFLYPSTLSFICHHFPFNIC